ncbi:MAG: adaptor protein MecA [Lachnospiraceae bacterium]|nr:adaptor protein MecA [Lachnospiraceae bacterium]
MKIEKLNENQIRCTLTKEDLASRELKISELAYGTEKAKSLFRDMMQQANHEFGFEAEDIPLMIEAVPVNAECIVLIITKVEDPEELDTRFSRFAPSVHEETDTEEDALAEASDEILDLFRKIQAGGVPQTETAEEIVAEQTSADNKPLVRLFRFPTMHALLSMAAGLPIPFEGDSSLFKDNKSQHYFLLLVGTQDAAMEYNKLCNMLSEYGALQRVLPTTQAFLEEHCETILATNALGVLAGLH